MPCRSMNCASQRSSLWTRHFLNTTDLHQSPLSLRLTVYIYSIATDVFLTDDVNRLFVRICGPCFSHPADSAP